LLAAVVVCTGAEVLVGGLDGGATGVVVFGADAGAVERAGAGAALAPVRFAGAVVLAARVPPVAEEEAPAAGTDAVVEAPEEPDVGADVPLAPDWRPVDAVVAVSVGAERAKSVTKATVANALSCVVRHVSLPSRLRPSPRPWSAKSSWRMSFPFDGACGRARRDPAAAARRGRQHIGRLAKTHLRSH
jgi:hypothetical protein